MVNEREEIFPGRECALHVFDVPAEEQKDLHSRLLWGIKRPLWEEKRVALMILFHTPENTDRYYAWVREEHEAERAGATRAAP